MKQKLLVGTLLFGVLPFLMGPTCTLVSVVGNPPYPPPSGPPAPRTIEGYGSYNLSNPPAGYAFTGLFFKQQSQTVPAAYVVHNVQNAANGLWHDYSMNLPTGGGLAIPGKWDCWGSLHYTKAGAQPKFYDSPKMTATVNF